MMDESSDTTTHHRLELGAAIDLELARIAQGPPGEEADRARRELLQRHDAVARRAAEHVGPERSERVLHAAYRGLEQAIRSFDPDRGAVFADYAAARARGAVRRVTHRAPQGPGSGMRQGRFLQVRVAMTALHEELHRSPTVDEVAEHLGFEPSDVLDALAVRSGERVRTSQLATRLAETDEQVTDLTEAVSELDERTRVVLYGLDCDGRRRRELASELGISTFDVLDLEQRGRARLRRVTAA